MSNFLNNLAGRALHTREAIRPRLPSLFESQGAGGFAAAAAPPAVELTSPAPANAASRTIYTPAPQHAAPTSEPRRRPDEEASQNAASRARVETQTGGREEVRREPGATVDDTRAAPEQPTRAAQAGRVETHVRVNVSGRGPDADEHANDGAREESARAASAEDARGLEARLGALEAALTRDAGRRETVRAVSQPVAPPAAAALFEAREESPHITVTIGRVDVRAVTAAPPQPRPAPAPRPATQTLEEYLKQRERGRR